uniref:14-3-3 domain-containing protein n=1 Tax=Arcella intermedia TaxID=1963864 RepID=A0A6B2LFF2_9EUKA
MQQERDTRVFLLDLALLAEIDKDIMAAVESLVELHLDWDARERNFISIAFKSATATYGRSARASLYLQEAREQDPKKLALVKAFLGRIQAEVNSRFEFILRLLEVHLVPFSEGSESKVFFTKMQADYLCMHAKENWSSAEGRASLQAAHRAYQAARRLASALPPTHALRLGLALNYSVFLYENMNYRAQAIEVSKEAFDEAMVQLDTLDESSYKDATLIMQLLRDNRVLWFQEEIEEDKEEVEEERF